ncbi:MAG: hypothetical protein L6R42_008995, partial [Xanthoria sp. 1 TBL-2021]
MITPKLVILLGIASLAACRVEKRSDPPFQQVPRSAKADNSFHVATQGLKQIGMPPDGEEVQPTVYGARSIDLPFGRLQHGKMKFFEAGELNTPTGRTDVWEPGKHDSAKQSACGIPDSAYQVSKVAIHPYWLKFAPLERYCMQDACISFWNEETEQGKQSDMMLKITDICSTDPNDPTACLTPYDIKIDRSKARIMQKMNMPGMPEWEEQEALNGTEFKGGKTWWFFMKCWADGTVQPAYKSPDNWFSTPFLESNVKWAQKAQTDQVDNNKVSYAEKGWQVYPNGAYRMDRNTETAPPLEDWKEGMPDPEWCPVAGGKGFGIPTGKDCSSGASPSTSQSNSTSSTGSSGYGNSTQGGGQGGGQAPKQASNQDSNQESSPSTETSSNSDSAPDEDHKSVPIASSSTSPPASLPLGDTASKGVASASGASSN